MKYNSGKFFGFFGGFILGALAGLGTLSQIKISQRTPEVTLFVTIGGAIVFGIGGLMKGSQWDDEDRANDLKKKSPSVNTIKQTANVKTTASPKVFRKKKSATFVQRDQTFPPKSSEFKMNTESEMQGEYWVFTTTWTNPTTKELVRIITQRNVSGELITTYEGQTFYYGAVTANKENVARYHKNKVDEIVKRL